MDYSCENLIIPKYTQEQIDTARSHLLDALETCDGVKLLGWGYIRLSVNVELFNSEVDKNLLQSLALYIHRRLCQIALERPAYENRLQVALFRNQTPKKYWQDKTYLAEKRKCEKKRNRQKPNS